jgi:hypothetical protein
VELAKRACCGVARIGEGLEVALQPRRVEAPEARNWQSHLTSHRDALARLPTAAQGEWNGLAPPEVSGYILAHAAVTAGRSDNQPPGLVDEFDTCTVEFGFGQVLDLVFTLERPAYPLVKSEHFSGVHGVVEREHRYAVFDRCETLARWSADSPGRGIRSLQLGIRRFERQEFPVHRVVFGVRDFRAVFQVIEPTVAIQFVDQLVNSARNGGLFSRTRHGSSDLIKAAARARAPSRWKRARNRHRIFDDMPHFCPSPRQYSQNRIKAEARSGR